MEGIRELKNINSLIIENICNTLSDRILCLIDERFPTIEKGRNSLSYMTNLLKLSIRGITKHNALNRMKTLFRHQKLNSLLCSNLWSSLPTLLKFLREKVITTRLIAIIVNLNPLKG